MGKLTSVSETQHVTKSNSHKMKLAAFPYNNRRYYDIFFTPFQTESERGCRRQFQI